MVLLKTSKSRCCARRFSLGFCGDSLWPPAGMAKMGSASTAASSARFVVLRREIGRLRITGVQTRRACKGTFRTLAQVALSAARRQFHVGLKNNLDGKLNLPLGDCGAQQRSRGTCRRCTRIPVGSKNVGVLIARSRRSKIGMIQNVEHLHAKLHVEIFGDALDLVVLEDGEIQVRHSGAIEDVAARIAPQVEAAQVSRRQRAAKSRRSRGAIGIEEGLIGSHWKAGALALSIVCTIARISRGATARAGKTIRVYKIVTAKRACRVGAGSPRRSKRYAITHGEDHSELPPVGEPMHGASERFRS